MKKFREIVALTLCLSTFSLFALGSGSDSSVDKEITNVGNSSESNTSDDNVQSGKDVSNNTSEKNKKVSIEETVLLNQNGIVITAKSIEDGFYGPELKILIENNSDTDLTFQVRNSSVNGYMTETMISEEVASGKKSNASIKFSASKLKSCGIDTFAIMEFSFHIFTTENWDTYIDTEPITVKTSAADTYNQKIDDSGEVFYNQDGIKIIGKGLSSKDSIFGPGLIIYIENSSSQDFTVQVRDTSINGFMVDTLMSEDVLAGKKAITAVTFMNSSLDANGISDIQSVETSFHVFSMDGWDTIVETNPITVNFN